MYFVQEVTFNWTRVCELLLNFIRTIYNEELKGYEREKEMGKTTVVFTSFNLPFHDWVTLQVL